MIKINIWKMALALILVTFAIQSKADEKLFQKWTFGTPLENMASSSDYYDCSEETGDNLLCLDNVDFLGEKFEAVFGFNGNRLEKVILLAPFSKPLQIKTLAALSRNFTLVSLEGKTERFDILQQLKETGHNNIFQSNIEDFEVQHISSGYISYLLLEQRFKEIISARDAFEAIRNLPMNTRAAEITIFDEDNGSWIALTFMIPQLSQKLIEEQAQSAPHEDF